jgi:SAM-dependent methyltransferase
MRAGRRHGSIDAARQRGRRGRSEEEHPRHDRVSLPAGEADVIERRSGAARAPRRRYPTERARRNEGPLRSGSARTGARTPTRKLRPRGPHDTIGRMNPTARGAASEGGRESRATVDCPACGRIRGRPWAREGPWAVVECEGCGLLMTWPRPTDAQLSRFYGEESYYERRGMGEDASAGARDRALDLRRRFPTATSVLDFGAGEGHLVKALRDVGIRAEGVEPARPGRDAALRLHAVELAPDLSAAVGAPWDLVLLVHSLEHVSDPLDTLRSIAARVARGTAIFVEVPHAASVEMWRRADRAKILDLPAHLFHFTPKTLAPLVRRSGFDVKEIRLVNCSWVEALLRLRAKREPTISSGGASQPEEMIRAAGDRSGLIRGIWRDRALPLLRRALPGWKFQLVASRTG